jgi:hypothetical protein
VVDVLISPFQPVNDDPDILAWTYDPPGVVAGSCALRRRVAPFMEAMGCTRIREERFHPFFHEIVAVEAVADPDHQPELVDERWPGYLVGSMLLVRAGVTVRVGGNVLDAVVASRSPLYWSWWRRNRGLVDCSHGWGGNSQWRTDFGRTTSSATNCTTTSTAIPRSHGTAPGTRCHPSSRCHCFGSAAAPPSTSGQTSGRSTTTT